VARAIHRGHFPGSPKGPVQEMIQGACALAGAAREHNGAGYRRAAAEVRRAENAVERELSSLSGAGNRA
jgi:hypothetical protein